jgi:peptidoglycan hydrolase CwlO-like protein
MDRSRQQLKFEREKLQSEKSNLSKTIESLQVESSRISNNQKETHEEIIQSQDRLKLVLQSEFNQSSNQLSKSYICRRK